MSNSSQKVTSGFWSVTINHYFKAFITRSYVGECTSLNIMCKVHCVSYLILLAIRGEGKGGGGEEAEWFARKAQHAEGLGRVEGGGVRGRRERG